MADLAPIIIPAASAASAALFATAGTLFVGRERTTQRIERLSQAMERCKDDEQLKADFVRTLKAELRRYSDERHGEWRSRLTLVFFGGSLYFLGILILQVTGNKVINWTFSGWLLLAIGSILVMSIWLNLDMKLEKTFRRKPRKGDEKPQPN